MSGSDIERLQELAVQVSPGCAELTNRLKRRRLMLEFMLPGTRPRRRTMRSNLRARQNDDRLYGICRAVTCLAPSLDFIAIGGKGISRRQLGEVPTSRPLPGLFDSPLGKLPVEFLPPQFRQSGDVCGSL
jgi:hypothetical protein